LARFAGSTTWNYGRRRDRYFGNKMDVSCPLAFWQTKLKSLGKCSGVYVSLCQEKPLK